MTRLTVLIDMDEVIVSLMDSWLDLYHQFGGEKRTRADITDYKMDDQFQNMKLFWQAIDRGPALRIAKPFPGAVEALKRLYDKYNVYLLTYARHESWGVAHEAKLAWLWQYAPWFDRDKVIFTRQKHLVSGDILVEDSAENIKRWFCYQDGRTAFLIDQPWNRSVHTLDKYRVSSLAEVADVLCGVE